ncbi:fad-linked oxidoreductase [Nannochloropsis gaditana CCMP526]|nr:fad-linked oxidoreductase [Nannochloropsis gaditana CCMP526]EKU23116.1 fad-linked oxidoreductase [Nannochloropsis gaditana CCMP526]|eukprot:XP_005852716.1 fad-linked oxidoreductase [Nannochloropsis gaditana CCMP526]
MGVAHSWSNVLPDDNTDVVFLDNFKLITQSPNDYSIVTVQAGVLQSELADWADSPARGYGRFSYLYQNTLVQPITFVGACQTASHGSGFVPPTPDYIIAMTIINANGEIKFYDSSHPDLRVMAACLGMCGIVLDVTVRFNPDTSATMVTQTKMQYYDLFPPRGVPINDSYNPLKHFIESHAGGAINYSPYNSALLRSAKLDVNMIEEYHQSDGVWAHAVDNLPGTPVCPSRDGLPIWGTQHEPFYDKDLFVPEDWLMNIPGSRIHRSFMGDWRLNSKWANYSPFMGQVVNNQVLFMNPPSFSYRTSVTYNTSNAGSTHFLRYIDGITSGLDFEFAFKVDDDFGNIYEAWRVMIEESENMWREKDMIPLNIFAAIRWVGASECPLSHAFGKPGERFAMLEPTSSHGTTGWEEYLKRVMARWTQIRSKDGSLPKPHWAKWYKDWTPEVIPYIKQVYAAQIQRIRPVVLRQDPEGIFRTSTLCDIFDLPCLNC